MCIKGHCFNLRDLKWGSGTRQLSVFLYGPTVFFMTGYLFLFIANTNGSSFYIFSVKATAWACRKLASGSFQKMCINRDIWIESNRIWWLMERNEAFMCQLMPPIETQIALLEKAREYSWLLTLYGYGRGGGRGRRTSFAWADAS